MKLFSDLGAGLYYFFYSTTSYFLSFPFFSSFFAPLAPFFSSFFFSSSNSFFFVNRGALIIWSYSSFKAYPLSCLSSNKNFCRAFLAFSARPGCLSSQDFRVSFYFYYWSVSLTNAMASYPDTWTDQHILFVSSLGTAAPGHSLKSKDA